MRLILACALLLALQGCSGTGALLYCLSVDHNINLKCQ